MQEVSENITFTSHMRVLKYTVCVISALYSYAEVHISQGWQKDVEVLCLAKPGTEYLLMCEKTAVTDGFLWNEGCWVLEPMSGPAENTPPSSGQWIWLSASPDRALHMKKLKEWSFIYLYLCI